MLSKISSKKITLVICMMVLLSTICSNNLTYASNTISYSYNIQSNDANFWNSYFGANEQWYEGSDGKLTQNTSTNFTAAIDAVGWGGIWGSYVSKDISTDNTFSIKQGHTYQISFDISARNVNKFVYLKISNNTSTIYSKWILLPAGHTIHFKDCFSATSNATDIRFGFGGDYGDRTDSDSYERYSVFKTQYSTLVHDSNYDDIDDYEEIIEKGLANDANGDYVASTVISCSHFSLMDINDIETTTEKIIVPEPPTPSIKVNKNQVNVILNYNDNQIKRGVLYNIYLDNKLVYSKVINGTYVIRNISPGVHIIKVISTLQGYTSSGKEIGFSIKQTKDIIQLQKPKIKKTKILNRKKIKLTFNKIAGINGYQIQYSTNRKFTNSRLAICSKATYTTRKLKKGKLYFFRVRAFKKDKTSTFFSKWSSVKKIRIKK